MRLGRRFRWAVAGLAFGAFASQVASLRAPAAEMPDYRGEEIPEASTPWLQVRKACRISALGVAPWRGVDQPMDAAWEARTRRMLEASGLPPAVAAKAVQRIRAGRPDEVVEFGARDGKSSIPGRRYLPTHSMAFMSGETPVVCHGSQLRFADPEHREDAMVFEVDGYHVAVFRKCRNPARVLLAPPGWMPAPGVMPPAPAPAPNGYGPGVAPLPYYFSVPAAGLVPEPDTLTLLAIALGALAFFLPRKATP